MAHVCGLGMGLGAVGRVGAGASVSVSSSHGAGRRARAGVRAPASAKSHSVTLLPGDGIGPEILSVTRDVLVEVGRTKGVEFSFTEALVGGAAIDAAGTPLPAETLEQCRGSDAVLLAAIGGYKWDSNPRELRPETGLLGLRAGLNTFANLRPAIVLPQLADASTLKREVVSGVDIMIIRELTGDVYFGEPKGIEVRDGVRWGFNNMIYSEPEVDRIARVAFDIARKRGKRVCSVDKANVLDVSQLWRDVVTDVHSEFGDVELSHMYVDNAAMQLIRNPKQFDVMVTGNIFGDILSDAASMLTGSLGMLPSASLSDSGPGVFEPVHGSAPDIAGQDLANPLAQILSAAMMCRYGLDEPGVAQVLEDAVDKVLDAGYRTGDIMEQGGNFKQVGCKAMGEAVLKAVQGTL